YRAGNPAIRERLDSCIASQYCYVQSEHLRLLGIVEQQFAALQAEHRAERVLCGASALAIVADPVAESVAELGCWPFGDTLVEMARAKRAEQWRRRTILQEVEQSLIREADELLLRQSSALARVFHHSLVHRRCTAHRVVPVNVAIHLVLRE